MSLVYQPTISNNVLDLIWNNTADAIFAIDYNGVIIDANLTFKNMLGWELEELDGIVFPPFILDRTNDEHQSLLKQLKDGQNYPYEIVRRKDKDGEILDVLASYWSVNDGNILAIGMYKDFTEQMIIQRKLEESEYCYRTLVEYLPEAIVKQRNNKLEFVNSAGIKFLGVRSLDEIINYSIWDFVSSDKKGEIQNIIDTIYDDNRMTESAQIVIDKFTRPDGEEIWAEVKVIPIGIKSKPDIQIVFSDVTEKKQYEAQLEFLAYHDPLTGLKNRRKFTEIVTESIESAKRNHKQLAIMYLDIDNFKKINDTHGHDVGDQLLQKFSERMRSSVREYDVLGRVGGDEFLVLMQNIKKEKELVEVAENMLLAFQEPYYLSDLKLHVTSSIGIAVFPNNGYNYQSLIHRADKALYRAKKQRNYYVFDDNIEI